MASVEEIVNDIKAILNQIQANTSVTAQETAQIKTDTDAILSTANSILATDENGFINLSQGIATIIDRQNEANSLLTINNEQNRVILCWLAILADLECKQLRRLETQIEIQTETRDSVRRLTEVLTLVHAREALEAERQEQLRLQIEKCCPPDTPEPGPCYEPCQDKESPPYSRHIGDFTPLSGKTTSGPE
jgi:hypothetical protein